MELGKNIGEYWGFSKLHFFAYAISIMAYLFLFPLLGEIFAILIGFFQLFLIAHLGWKASVSVFPLKKTAVLGAFFGLATAAASVFVFMVFLALLSAVPSDEALPRGQELNAGDFAVGLVSSLLSMAVLGVLLCVLGALAATYYYRWVRKPQKKEANAAEVQGSIPRAARRRMQK